MGYVHGTVRLTSVGEDCRIGIMTKNSDISLQQQLETELAKDEKPVSGAVSKIIDYGFDTGASDMHLEPTEDGIEIKCRIDGVLHPTALIDANFKEQVVARIKVLSHLLTYRQDIPQDGKISGKDVDKGSDVRVSVFPTVRGEKIVLRFFQHEGEEFELGRLGLGKEIEDHLAQAVVKPEGVIVLTGQSGSGKTTTIYSLVRKILQESAGTRHIVTVEDPVEQTIPGVTQTQANPAVGLTFSECVRSILRQDPEVIIIGEIRDPETASIAFRAGLTGHLVITTLHSGTAVGVIERLLDMGVENHVITSTLSCVLAQRLVRKLCPICREQDESSTGCEECKFTGYSGRQVFGEFLVFDDILKEAVRSGKDRSELERIARSQGMVALDERGHQLVEEGVTSETELRRVMG